MVRYAIYKNNDKILSITFPQIRLRAKWTELLQLCENNFQVIEVNMVKWKRPPNQWIKINLDGSELCNPRRIRAGGILRDQTGKLLMAFTNPIGEGTTIRQKFKHPVLG